MWNFGSRSNPIQLVNATQFYEIGTLVCGLETAQKWTLRQHFR